MEDDVQPAVFLFHYGEVTAQVVLLVVHHKLLPSLLCLDPQQPVHRMAGVQIVHGLTCSLSLYRTGVRAFEHFLKLLEGNEPVLNEHPLDQWAKEPEPLHPFVVLDMPRPHEFVGELWYITHSCASQEQTFGGVGVARFGQLIQ